MVMRLLETVLAVPGLRYIKTYEYLLRNTEGEWLASDKLALSPNLNMVHSIPAHGV